MKRLLIPLVLFSFLLPHVTSIAHAFQSSHRGPRCTHRISPLEEEHKDHGHKCTHHGHDEQKCTCSHAFSCDTSTDIHAMTAPAVETASLKEGSVTIFPFTEQNFHTTPAISLILTDICIPVPERPPAI
ncbi:MAG: hypothetical protein GY721_09190 [Deltaproteobacteria bacterium]|nr:hypothetical protein [Deltaproteobacteria bacterium]